MVAALEASDAERLFEALRSEVTGAEDLTGRPGGVEGLVEICRHHPSLQSALVGMLRDLPVARLGAWVVSGWTPAVTQENAKREFEELRSAWGVQDENKELAAAAVAASKVASRRRSRH